MLKLGSANVVNRRMFLRTGLIAAGACFLSDCWPAWAAHRKKIKLFNGTDLEGWVMAENSQTSLSSGDITDPGALAKAIKNKSNAVAAYLRDVLSGTVKSDLAAFDASDPAGMKAARSGLAKSLTEVIRGPSIYDRTRFQGIALGPATKKLVGEQPTGRDLAEMNRCLLADAFPDDIAPAKPGWTVKDEIMASTGSGRGAIYTARDFGRFRWMFTIRHLSGNPDHQACVLIFCSRPAPNTIPLDALGGIQFQVPRGGHWDYRPGHNNAGEGDFTSRAKVSFDPHEWSRVEIVADASAGRARMAVAQPVGSKAVEVVDFTDPTAGKVGPVALQMHNAGLFDEYKDLTIEMNPRNMDLITTGERSSAVANE